mmetsp:Transcript_55104/g.128981  ORF Transcript_55104/g.128981 Transcript_55104/m.128981 type:complete len:867 (+) Transcript_55104:118-2718(+)
MEDSHDEFSGLDQTALTDKLNALKAEKERKHEMIERLQEKLKALNNELASRRQERDSCLLELKNQQNRNKRLIARRKQEGGDTSFSADQEEQKDKVKKCVEEALQEKVRKFSRRTENGFRIFDEMDLMVEKPMEDQMNENYVDTVLVTYKVPNSEQAYKLSYRIDKQTKAYMLREDACRYWEISEVEFVLKTFDGSKVHDDICVHSVFLDNEPAELLLAQKKPKLAFNGLNAIPYYELEAVRAKTGKAAKAKTKTKKAPEGETRTSKHQTSEGFFDSLQGAPGLWKFMTQRDLNYKGHLSRIRLRNILIYALLWSINLFSMLTYRPQLVPYINFEGLYTSMTGARLDPSGISVKAFQNISTVDEAWNWLTYTVSAELLVNSSTTRSGFYPNSYMDIRMQQVKGDEGNATESCTVDAPAGMACYDVFVNSETEGVEDLESLRLYWEGGNGTDDGVTGLDGRHTAVAPWRHVSHEDAVDAFLTTPNQGRFQSYDASGYRVQYFLQHQDLDALYEAYRSDMVQLKSLGWGNRRVRSLMLSLVTYSGNFDMWSAARFLFEMPTSGQVRPKVDIEQYEPASLEELEKPAGESEVVRFEVFIADTIGYILALYVGIGQVIREIHYEMTQNGKSFLTSLLQVCILWDLLICCSYNVLYMTRYIHFDTTTKDYALDLSDQFQSGMDHAYWYSVKIMLHVVVICAVSIRILGFLTLSRHWYVLWRTMSDAAKALSCVLVIFLPTFVGLVALAYATWGDEKLEFRTYQLSAISVLKIAKGDLEISSVSQAARPWATGVALFTRILFEVIFFNIWIGLLCHIYQKTRVRYGYNASEYQWPAMEWARWFTFSSLFKISGWQPIAKAEEENAIDDEEEA